MKDETNHLRLPRELVWDGAHVSELALTAIADGQEAIVQGDAVAHAEACDFCAGRMARAALLSAAVAGVVAASRPVRDPARQGAARQSRPAPAPWKALALGVAVAALAAIPSLPHFASTLPSLLAYGKTFSSHGIPVLVRGGAALAASESRAIAIATIVSAALLVMMGFAIARVRSPETSERSMS
jgi:hypothetical protein